MITLPYRFFTTKFPRITVVGAFGFEDVDLLGTGHDHSLEVYLQSDESESVGLLLFVFLFPFCFFVYFKTIEGYKVFKIFIV